MLPVPRTDRFIVWVKIILVLTKHIVLTIFIAIPVIDF